MMRVIDLTGHRFGRLVALRRTAPKPHENGTLRYWVCVCDCGTIKELITSRLRNGGVRSCGCLLPDLNRARSTHGACTTPAYASWKAMRSRCANKKDHNYGGRGITVCERWNSFEAFLADMGEPPAGMEIERVDNNGHYCPENCVWTTTRQNARNRRTNRMVTIDNETRTLIEWCERLGRPYYRTSSRINREGWTISEALGVDYAVDHKALAMVDASIKELVEPKGSEL